MIKKIIFAVAIASGLLNANELQNSIDRAVVIVRDFEALPEKGIPHDVLKNAEGLAILNLIKAGVIVSGRGGVGLVVARIPGGWSAPCAIGVGGAGFGAQIGAEVTECILVLNTKEAVIAFSKAKNFTLGGNVSVAAGPVGRALEGQVTPKAAVYSYSLSQGLFAGISLEGTIIAVRKEVNNEFYKGHWSAREILSGKIPRPASAKLLYQELNKYNQ